MERLPRPLRVGLAMAPFLLSACTPITASVPLAKPSQLLGGWDVTDVASGRTQVVSVGRQDYAIALPCGIARGEWKAARGGLFAAVRDGVTDACVRKTTDFDGLWPSWVDAAVGFERHGAQRVLLDPGGRTVAIWRRLEGAQAVPALGDDTLSTETVTRFDDVIDAAALPPTLRPAESADLIGRWRAERPESGDCRSVEPSVEFRPDGRYVGSAGRSAIGGRWAAGGGALVILARTSPMVGCDILDPSVASTAVGVEGDRLVFVGHHGVALYRYTRD